MYRYIDKDTRITTNLRYYLLECIRNDVTYSITLKDDNGKINAYHDIYNDKNLLSVNYILIRHFNIKERNTIRYYDDDIRFMEINQNEIHVDIIIYVNEIKWRD